MLTIVSYHYRNLAYGVFVSFALKERFSHIDPQAVDIIGKAQAGFLLYYPGQVGAADVKLL